MTSALADQLDELRLYTREQVVELTGSACSEWWLDEMCRQGRIPWRKVGRERRFAREDILAIYEAIRVQPTAKPPQRRRR